MTDQLALAYEQRELRRAERKETGTQMGERPVESVKVKTTTDSDKYDEVLRQAREIFIERNSIRQSAFRDAGWKGNLVEMRKKLDRLWAAWQMSRALTDSELDEALDLINATVFFLICADEKNHDGNWPWP